MVHKEVIPTLFALDKKEFEKKLNILSFCESIHIDFMDGEFTENKSVDFRYMQKLKSFSNISFGVHLMAYDPLKYLHFIKSFKIKRVYVHFEVYNKEFKFDYDIGVFKDNGLEVGLVLNPQTKVSDVPLNFLKKVDYVMIMSVNPGAENQKFIDAVLTKIKNLRDRGFKGKISIDGGVKDTNIENLSFLGVDVFYVGSFISGSKNPKENYKKLLELVGV